MSERDWLDENEDRADGFLAGVAMDRRTLLRRGIGGAALLGLPGLIAACGGSSGSSTSGGGGAPSVPTGDVAPLNQIFGPGGKQAGRGTTMSLGMLLAVTGQGSFYGRVMSRGAKLAASQIKAAGGPEFDISIGDHQSGAVPPGVSAVRRMTTENHIRLLQTSYGAVSEAIAPLIAQQKILTFNGGGSSPGQVGKPFLWQTRMLFGDDPVDGSLAWVVKTYPKAKRIAVVGTLENAVEAEKKKIPRIWPQLTNGGQVVATEIHDVGETDFGTIIARLKAAKPDVIWTGDFGNDTGYLVKQARQASVTVPIIGVEFTDQAAKIAGKAYDTFIFGGDYFDPRNKNPFTVEFVKAHKQAYKVEPEFYGANYYEHPFIFWELVRRTIKAGGDPKNTEDLQKQIEANPEFPSVYGGGAGKVGTMRFNPSDHTVDKPMGMFKVRNGVPYKVATIKRIKPSEDPHTALVSMD